MQQDGPSLWMIWGEMKEGLGRLEAAIVTNVKHIHQRQDDMRRETMEALGRLERRLDERHKTSGLDLAKIARKAPWWALSRLSPPALVALLYSLAGSLGWKIPRWLQALLAAF